MTVIASIDGASRRIFLHADTVGALVNPMDIYKEMRTLRRTDESLQKWSLFMSASGNVPKGGGKFTERLVTLLNGTRIVPFNTDHALTVTGTIITDNGTEGIAAFDRSPLDITTTVDINYVPPQVEIIQVSSGSGLSNAQNERLFATATQLTATKIEAALYGNWQIIGTQLIMYDLTGSVIKIFDLLDKSGDATDVSVFSRVGI